MFKIDPEECQVLGQDNSWIRNAEERLAGHEQDHHESLPGTPYHGFIVPLPPPLPTFKC